MDREIILRRIQSIDRAILELADLERSLQYEISEHRCEDCAHCVNNPYAGGICEVLDQCLPADGGCEESMECGEWCVRKHCPRCGHTLTASPVKGYSWYCPDCDEDFYDIEMR